MICGLVFHRRRVLLLVIVGRWKRGGAKGWRGRVRLWRGGLGILDLAVSWLNILLWVCCVAAA